VIAFGETAHRGGHGVDRRHDRPRRQVDHRAGDREPGQQHAPEQLDQDPAALLDRGGLADQELRLAIDHPAGADAVGALAQQDVEQPSGTRRGLRHQQLLGDVPAVGAADLEHLRRKRRELAAGVGHSLEGGPLRRGEQMLHVGEIAEALFVDAPEALEIRLEPGLAGEQVGVDAAECHAHAAAHVGHGQKQVAPRLAGRLPGFLVDHPGDLLDHGGAERRGFADEDLRGRQGVLAVRDLFDVRLNRPELVEDRLRLRPGELVGFVRPALGELLDAGAVGVDLAPERRPLLLELGIGSQHPAAQRRERAIQLRHDVFAAHGGGHADLDHLPGQRIVGRDAPDRRSDGAGQDQTESREADDQPVAYPQVGDEIAHGCFLVLERPGPAGRPALSMTPVRAGPCAISVDAED